MADPRDLRDKCAIAGIGITDLSKNSGRSEITLACQAIEKALDDAGIDRDEVDGLAKWDMDSSIEWHVAKNAGFKNIRFHDQVSVGGGAACGTVAHAVMAIATGMANCVVAYRALNGRSGARFTGMSGSPASVVTANYIAAAARLQWTAPFGLQSANQQAALQAQRYIHKYGATSQQLGAVAVACRKHAQTNPNALMYGKPITLEDHQNSRMIADPLRLLDCTLETDGGGAVVVVSAERAKDLKQPPVYIMAAAQGLDNMHEQMSNYTRDMASFPESRRVAEQLYRIAGVKPSDIDVAQIYDAYTIVAVAQLEAYGFCKPGEGASFVEGGRVELGGALPINTSGGNLSEGYLHGMTHIIEAVRQLRGTSPAQVANAEVSLVTSGPVCPTSGLILRR